MLDIGYENQLGTKLILPEDLFEKPSQPPQENFKKG